MRDKIELQLDNRQVVSFVIGSLVVLGVVFALGVLVGKQLAADALAQVKPADPLAAIDAQEARLAATVEAAQPVAAAPAAPAASPVEPVAPAPRTLTFAQELTRPDPGQPVLHVEPAVAKKPEARKEEKAAEVKREEPRREEKLAAEPASAEKRREGLAAAFDKVAPKAAAREGFTLQVSSFPDRPAAEKFAAGLNGRGFDAFVAEADIPGKGRYFRVKVGAFDTRGEADAFLKTFRARTDLQAFVTSVK
ncbi:MAG: SPOR domain-containing protein [Myxococcales bacterium]